jgi:hypothetical protein
MHLQFLLRCFLFLSLTLLGQNSAAQDWRPIIPKSWDAQELEAWTIPPRNPGVYTVHLSPAFVYSIPPYPIYKSYPIYHPSKEPKAYMDWLSQQEPEITFDAGVLRTEADWVAAGKLVFEAPQDFEPAEKFRNPEWYEKLRVPLTSEGVVPGRRYVIRKKGFVEAAAGACVACHSRVMPDGTLLNGAQSNFPYERDIAWRMRKQRDIEYARGLLTGLHFPSWSLYSLADGIAGKDIEEIAQMHDAIPPGLNCRIGVSALTPPKVADLIGVKERKYLDLIARVQHRNIGDLMRYVNFEPGEKAFFAERTAVPAEVILKADSMYRYSDEQAFALALYIYSLQPPRNPNPMDASAAAGQKVFEREGCPLCHTPPLYTNNKLTLAGDFQPPPEHRAKYDILDVRVNTDPRSSMLPMRGTGYYKVPSLRGVWYRGPFEHNGSVATLEDWFDPQRLQADYAPTGFIGYRFRTRAVPGHQFGLKLSDGDKKALIAFLRTL